MSEQAPIALVVTWVGRNMKPLALEILKSFFIDPERPFGRNTGIPVFLCQWENCGDLGNLLEAIRAEKKVVVPFVDDLGVVTDGWLDQIRNLKDVIPVAITRNALNIDGLNNLNFIRYYAFQDGFQRLGLELGIELLRLFRGFQNRLQIFLSHKKGGPGEDIVKYIQCEIHANTTLNTFFDVNSISKGQDFIAKIDKGIKNSLAVVVIRDDEFSSSTWCAMEVKRAKEYGVPVIVVNAMTNGEARAFPYLGNTPVFRWFEGGLEPLLNEIVFHVLGFEMLRAMVTDKEVRVLPVPPELLTKNNGTKVVYPDPPMNFVERDILGNNIEAFSATEYFAKE